MLAEFRDDDTGLNNGLPQIVISTQDRTEWVALQLYMRLFNSGKVRLTAEFIRAENPNEQ